MPGWILTSYRFLYFISYTLWRLTVFFFWISIGVSRKEAGFRTRRKFLYRIPRAMGLTWKVTGQPLPGPALYIANHISYIDPIVALMHIDAFVVAKAEVRKWPLVGLGAHVVGTIFVNREEKSSRRETSAAIRNALQAGQSILIFPEGTTTAGPGTLPFKPRSFTAAEEAQVPVQPIAIYYPLAQVAFIGQDSFLSHFFRLFRNKQVEVFIQFGPALTAPDTVGQARQWIDNAMLNMSQNRLSHVA